MLRRRDQRTFVRASFVRASLLAGMASVAVVSVVSGQLASPMPSPAASATAEQGHWPAGSAAPSASPGVSPPAATVEVQAFDLGFTPTTIEVAASGTSRILLMNTGFVTHNITVDSLGVLTVASRGGTGEAFVTDPAPGTYEFYCSISGHKEGGMVGTLLVR